ncbi:protein kinase domain-containing protein [Idiomarina aminovorans]|uniref:protein kinase domain-containing protein n=1 Tax=Idiomarina aminovorans TaxID=2914829 RepID=UPI002003B236|nr:protein kinase [Idiomarina sp. ATCH4]MCK7459586.1 protein kinase [Idiomarina sp. ATCH4]
MAEEHPDTTFPYPIPARYRCIRLLGQGGSGLVYKAHDQRLNRNVAIKFARSPSIVSRHRLVNEARLLSSVDHPALCRVFDVGEPEIPSSSLFMVLEYIEGKPLSKLQKSMSVYDTVKVVHSLTEGVCLMHEAGYAHNDINLHNIMLRVEAENAPQHNKEAVLVDLSIAAPSSPASIQRDIYQLSSLLLFLLTKMKPEHFFQQPITYQGQIPSNLSRMIKQALSLEPNSRFRNCDDLRQELSSWLNRYQSKKRIFKFAAANVTVAAIIVLIFVFLREPTTEHLFESYSTEQNHYEHALVFAHYSQHLANDGYTQQAADQAESALIHFDDLISDRPNKLNYHGKRAEFILNSEKLFSNAQLTTMLLNAINEFGETESYDDAPAAHYFLAKMYLGLARLNSEQPHLVERWKGSAAHSINAAIKHRPDVDRYRELHSEIRQYQSSGGTD